jgi:hypothetical protein
MEEPVILAPAEEPPDRPFARLARTAADLGHLQEMARTLRRVLTAPVPAGARPLVLDAAPPGGRAHRIVLCDEGRLRTASAPALVGFFAEKRLGVDHAPLTETDDLLIGEFPAYPGILSYSSLELPDGNWGNLIVLDPPETREHWRTSARHAWAAEVLAPRHYTVVRLHHGRFPGGVLGPAGPVLTRTRYFDFQGPVPWRAERSVTPGA